MDTAHAVRMEDVSYPRTRFTHIEGSRQLTEAELKELLGDIADPVPIKVSRETKQCPSCHYPHSLSEWEGIMSGQESDEWAWA